MHRHGVVYGIGAAGLGVTGLVVGDFALQWQPVPEGIPFRTPLAYASALALLAGGLLILTRRFAMQGACIVGVVYGLDVLLLQMPKALAAPLSIGAWLGAAELLALALAGLLLACALDDRSHARIRRWSLVAFGCCPVVWGLSHFGYPEVTASMIPEWIPGRLFWAYATGTFHIAAGVGILAGVFAPGGIAGIAARLAPVMLTIMLGLFTLLVHVTGVAGDPSSRLEWTMLFVATSLTGSAWTVSGVAGRAGKGLRGKSRWWAVLESNQ